MKIVSIAHSAVRRSVGRLRYYPLAGRQDLDVHLVVPERWHQFGRTMKSDPADDPGLTVHSLPILLPRLGPTNWYLHFYPGMRRLLRRTAPAVIHLWEEPWSVVALQAALLKGSAALVIEVDQNILKRLPPPFESIRRYVLGRTAHVLSRSPDATSVVRAVGYRGPVTEIGYGVDQETFQPSGARPANAAEKQSLRVGYVGRLVEEKGLDDALDAIARARSPITLEIMGEGPYAGRLRERAYQLGIADRVTFRSWGSETEVARFLGGLDVLVLLTRTTGSVREQFGRVILEAQSCGTPVIGSECGAIPSVVGDGGWIVPEHDPGALATVLDAIAADPRDRSLKSAAGLRNIATRFTYEIVAETLADTWMAAAAARKARDVISQRPESYESEPTRP